MKEFSNEDLKAGMLVELKNGIIGILIPLDDRLEVYNANFEAEAEASLLSNDIFDTIKISYSIVKVYSLSNSVRRLFDTQTRQLLWEYEEPKKEMTIKEKEMTIKDIEAELGYKIKIVGNKEK